MSYIPEEEPPVFKTWPQVYAFVLILHVIILLAFYVFTQYFA